MNLKKKIIGMLLVGVLVLTGCNINISKPKGAENLNKEVANKTILVMGEDMYNSPDKAKLQQRVKDLGFEDVKEYVLSKDDYRKYLNVQGDVEGLYSSVIVKYQEGKGITSNILTPENITKIKNHQYTNAAVTAGLFDVDLNVISLSPVTGESALAGVFKAYDVLGLKLDNKKLETAQDELSTIANISVTLNEQELEKLSTVLLNTKKKLSESKVDGKDVKTEEVLDKELKDQGLELEEDQKLELTKVLDGYKENTSKEDAQVMLDRASEIGKTIFEGSKDVINKANNAGVFDSIGRFFKSLFN